MDERDKRRIGEEIEPGGRPKAPGRLELLQRFVNTHNHDLPTDWDRIGNAKKAQTWLREKGLTAASDRISAADAARLRELREAVRSLVMANHGGQPDPAAIELVRAASSSARLAIPVADGGRTVPAGTAR